jgi:hypothetical protein
MKTVRFLQKQSPYNAGEVAGFSDEICERYVNAKVAEIVPSEEPIQDEAVLDAAQWKKKFYDAATAHKKERHDIVEYLDGMEKERDALKSRVLEFEAKAHEVAEFEKDRDFLIERIAELEGLLAKAPAGPVGPDGAPIDVIAKGEDEKPAGNEPAAGADTGASLQPSAGNEPAANQGGEDKTGGINETNRAAETERRSGRRR